MSYCHTPKHVGTANINQSEQKIYTPCALLKGVWFGVSWGVLSEVRGLHPYGGLCNILSGLCVYKREILKTWVCFWHRQMNQQSSRRSGTWWSCTRSESRLPGRTDDAPQHPTTHAAARMHTGHFRFNIGFSQSNPKLYRGLPVLIIRDVIETRSLETDIETITAWNLCPPRRLCVEKWVSCPPAHMGTIRRIRACLIRNCLHFLQRWPSDQMRITWSRDQKHRDRDHKLRDQDRDHQTLVWRPWPI